MSAKLSRKQPIVSTATKLLAADAIVIALAERLPSTGASEVARLFDRGYLWFAETNRQKAMEHVQAAMIAHEHNLAQQVALHLKQAQTATTRDVADRARAAVAKKFSYRGPCHFNTSLGCEPFVVSEVDEDRTRYGWHYTRIEQFGRLIPAQALATLAYLEQTGLSPQAYWVADKRQQASRRSVDPILSCQFGPWFVAIAEWV